MAGKRKRKFNWNELSSEDEEEVKKVSRKDKKAVEDQAKKLDQLSVSKNRSTRSNAKLVDSDEELTLTRSTRGTKRKIDENSLKSKKIATPKQETPKNDSSPVKLERSIDESPKLKSARLSFKEEKLSPEDKNNSLLKSSPKDIKSPKENKPLKEIKSIVKKKLDEDDSEELNVLPDKNVKSETQDSDQLDDFNLPAINVKSIQLKMFKKPDSCKKFNKKHSSPSVSPIKPKFSEIKIELNEEQRDWFNKQLAKYDGKYDREFDAESDLYVQAPNPRKRKY